MHIWILGEAKKIDWQQENWPREDNVSSQSQGQHQPQMGLQTKSTPSSNHNAAFSTKGTFRYLKFHYRIVKDPVGRPLFTHDRSDRKKFSCRLEHDIWSD